MEHNPREETELKATPDDQALLLQLQEQDSLLARLAHRRSTLPELARLAESAVQRTDSDGRRIELQTALDDLERERRKADAEVEQVRARKARDVERLGSGMISDPKALGGLQHELGALDRRIASLEDAELEVMEQMESIEAELAEVVAALVMIDADIAEATTTRDVAVVDIDADIATATAQRASLVDGLPDALLALYDKIRAQYAGLGAVALVAGRCEGCRLQLNGADLRELAGAPTDEVARCPECNRILVRGPGSGL